jgi:hypothetical protein
MASAPHASPMIELALGVTEFVVTALVVPVVTAWRDAANGCGWVPLRFAAGGGSASEPHDSRPS